MYVCGGWGWGRLSAPGPLGIMLAPLKSRGATYVTKAE